MKSVSKVMKSIYSLEVLQRIIDHWSIGRIEDVTYFEKSGRNIWRHYIQTNQGEFELYSYPTETREYSEPKLAEYLLQRYPHTLDRLKHFELIHSFDRYHVLLQLTTRHTITSKQAHTDLDLLLGLKIEKAFRVYGSIFQIHLNDSGVLVSYGHWNVQSSPQGEPKILADTHVHHRDQLDQAIEQVEQNHPTITKYILHGSWFELYLSNQLSLHFTRSRKFPAIEVHLPSRRNDVLIFSEEEIVYTRDFRD